jgi:hypothetical protein
MGNMQTGFQCLLDASPSDLHLDEGSPEGPSMGRTALVHCLKRFEEMVSTVIEDSDIDTIELDFSKCDDVCDVESK